MLDLISGFHPRWHPSHPRRPTHQSHPSVIRVRPHKATLVWAVGTCVLCWGLNSAVQSFLWAFPLIHSQSLPKCPSSFFNSQCYCSLHGFLNLGAQEVFQSPSLPGLPPHVLSRSRPVSERPLPSSYPQPLQMKPTLNPSPDISWK